MNNVTETQISPAVRTKRGKDRLAAYFSSKQAEAEFIRLTPTARSEKSLLLAAEFRMESLSMLTPDTFTGPTWVFPAGTMVPLSAQISTVRIV